MLTLPRSSGEAATLPGRAYCGRAISLDLIGRSEDMITACVTAGGWMALKVSRLIPEPVDGLGTRTQAEHSNPRRTGHIVQ